MSAKNFKPYLKKLVPDLLQKFINPNILSQDLAQYLIIIEHVTVCLIFILNEDEKATEESMVYIENLSFISQLVRFKRESLSIITCMFINLLITNLPIIIPEFLKGDLISDLIYGVKNNIRVGCEVMNILSLISSMKVKVKEDNCDSEWLNIADE